MPEIIDLESWPRKSHFDFFKGYDNPFYNICATVDVTKILDHSRADHGPSFFLATLYLSLKTINEIREFRMRIEGSDVIVHEIVHAGSTVLLDDETFAFAYFDYCDDFETFSRQASVVIEKTKSGYGGLEDKPKRHDLIHYTVIPWITFTGFSHARRWGTTDSIPKIVFGRYQKQAETIRMPVSVEVHHSLVDGLHVGRFFQRFQEYLDQPIRQTMNQRQ